MRNIREVQTEDGEWIDFDAAVNMMDDEIRERLHIELMPSPGEEIPEQEFCQNFYNQYVKLHAEKYNGEKFVI